MTAFDWFLMICAGVIAFGLIIHFREQEKRDAEAHQRLEAYWKAWVSRMREEGHL